MLARSAAARRTHWHGRILARSRFAHVSRAAHARARPHAHAPEASACEAASRWSAGRARGLVGCEGWSSALTAGALLRSLTVWQALEEARARAEALEGERDALTQKVADVSTLQKVKEVRRSDAPPTGL